MKSHEFRNVRRLIEMPFIEPKFEHHDIPGGADELMVLAVDLAVTKNAVDHRIQVGFLKNSALAEAG